MSFVRFAVVLLSFVLAGLMAGCHPGTQTAVDEQKEPYFLAAKRREQQQDFQGAIEYYEKALDVNPRSASAHLELAILYEREQSDWAAALYHYTRVLKIRPDYPASDVIKQRVEECKRELAKSVVQLPSAEALQRKVEGLNAENQTLKQNLLAWQNYYGSHGPAPSNSTSGGAVLSNVSNAPVQAQRTAVEGTGRGPAPAPPSGGGPTNPGRASLPPATSRSYVVASGDTLDRIAKRFGVKVSALQSANPTVDARRIRPGQTLVIPAATP